MGDLRNQPVPDLRARNPGEPQHPRSRTDLAAGVSTVAIELSAPLLSTPSTTTVANWVAGSREEQAPDVDQREVHLPADTMLTPAGPDRAEAIAEVTDDGLIRVGEHLCET